MPARTDEGEAFSDADVVNHMIFLLMAAHDTSTITLSAMMQYLGQHPEWQDRCREECWRSARAALAELEALCPSLDLVMKESLRLVTPVPVVARRTVEETTCWATGPGRHLRDDRAGRSPTTRRSAGPTRVASTPSGSRRAPRGQGAPLRLAPFGGGVHKCLGMYFGGAEVKTVMRHLLRRFEWRVDPATSAARLHSLPFPADGQPVDLRLR